ncbi:MAG: ribulose-phosphate 3-epimerase [Planctomycetaceae bacterium]|jgi:ribulose-phosphate 3-epimerase|nr:ribulose-phosphate 3-epimerase [Planctomycetaceae bacterium]
MVKFIRGGLCLNPSLLAADFANLESEIKILERAGASILHLDIMDGHFVPNISFGVPVVEAIRRVTELTLDVHLMLSRPADYFAKFRQAGADLISFHIETVEDPRPLFDQIRKLGALAGIVLNPPTPVEKVAPFVKDCDLVLTMGVMPGFGGQKFESCTIDKLKYIKKISSPDLLISVDGGIGEQTIKSCVDAGANLFVAGTALFGGGIEERFRLLSGLLYSNCFKIPEAGHASVTT